MPLTPETNVQTKIEGGQLIITIDLDNVQRHPSHSGKTMLIATTSGNIRIQDGITLGINCYTSR